MISIPPPRKFLTVPNPLPIILNKLLMGLRKGPIIESITPTIFAVILPINSSTAHAMGFTIPFVIAFFNIFLIVLPNAFFTVEPRHPNASKSLFTGFAAPSENASNCASAARGVILDKKNIFTPSSADSMNPPKLSSSKVLRLVVIPPTMSVILLVVVSILSTISSASPNPPETSLKNEFNAFVISDLEDELHFLGVANTIQVMVLFSLYSQVVVEIQFLLPPHLLFYFSFLRKISFV